MRDKKLKKVRQRLIKEREFLISLLPYQFQKEFRQRAFIGGGAIYSLYNGEEPKDFDFFLDSEEFAEKIKTTFKEILNPETNIFGTAEKKVIKGWYRGVFVVITNNGISLGKHQIITRWTGKPEVVVNEFDFKHNMFYMYKEKIGTYSQWDYLEDNVLRYNEKRARDICGTIIRVKKFVERGFTITNKEMAKMLLKLNDVGFNEREMEILEQAEGSFES